MRPASVALFLGTVGAIWTDGLRARPPGFGVGQRRKGGGGGTSSFTGGFNGIQRSDSASSSSSSSNILGGNNIFGGNKNTLGSNNKAIPGTRIRKANSPEAFRRFSHFEFTAYCPKMHDGKVGTLACSDSQGQACPGWENITLKVEFQVRDRFSPGGYVTVDPYKKVIVAVFKGTDTMYDLLMDLSKHQVDFPLCKGCRVHQGFYQGYLKLEKAVKEAIRWEQAKTAQKGWGIVVTGHSFGGGLAFVAAAKLRAEGFPCDVYSYGGPYTGNQAFANFLSQQPGFTARITNAKDIITTWPKRGFLLDKYAHVYPEYFFEQALEEPALFAGPMRVCRAEKDCGAHLCLKELFQKGFRNSCKLRNHGGYVGGLRPCDGDMDPIAKTVERLTRPRGKSAQAKQDQERQQPQQQQLQQQEEAEGVEEEEPQQEQQQFKPSRQQLQSPRRIQGGSGRRGGRA